MFQFLFLRMHVPSCPRSCSMFHVHCVVSKKLERKQPEKKKEDKRRKHESTSTTYQHTLSEHSEAVKKLKEAAETVTQAAKTAHEGGGKPQIESVHEDVADVLKRWKHHIAPQHMTGLSQLGIITLQDMLGLEASDLEELGIPKITCRAIVSYIQSFR